MRICTHPPPVDANELEQRTCTRKSRLLVDPLVRAHRVHELIADTHHRVERIHRALQHHGDVAPAVAPKLLVSLSDKVRSLEEDAASRNVSWRAKHLHHRICDRGLAATRLARMAQKLA